MVATFLNWPLRKVVPTSASDSDVNRLKVSLQVSEAPSKELQSRTMNWSSTKTREADGRRWMKVVRSQLSCSRSPTLQTEHHGLGYSLAYLAVKQPAGATS
ncbi:hypothetical protein EYF80_040878 [Liparis tanakae]|uniref:Uncharacterized protein n=1 Tax=Liparis tanakae TaxID=230148 RepID=A0A4Z2G740_9TELE|nr:hypothetical protein EYF80_040878 [Liparis tanakae]